MLDNIDIMNCSRTEAESERDWEQIRRWDKIKETVREQQIERARYERERYNPWGIERTTTEPPPVPKTLTLPQTITEQYATLASTAIDSFKKIKDINPKIIEDLTGIFEKFPCNKWVSIPIEKTVSAKMM